MLRVRFRTYCQGCRYGRRWNGGCHWTKHRYDWEYWIHCDGRRLIQRQGFHGFDRAWDSARRSYIKLASTACILTTPALEAVA